MSGTHKQRSRNRRQGFAQQTARDQRRIRRWQEQRQQKRYPGRHLTPSQLGMVGAKLAEVESERARKRQVELAGTRPTSLSRDSKVVEECGETAVIIGKKLGIGSATVSRAIKVRKNAAPEVVAAVAKGCSSAWGGVNLCQAWSATELLGKHFRGRSRAQISTMTYV